MTSDAGTHNSHSLRAAVLQMQSGPQWADNLAQAETLIAEAAQAGAQLAVLPENFALFGNRDPAVTITPNRPGPVGDFLAEQSRRHRLWLVAGTVAHSHSAAGLAVPADKVFAGSGLWSDEGRCVARYDKCHLFDVDVADGVGRYRESDTYAPGESLCLADTPWGPLGLSVCYDLRFPELYRSLAAQGAQILTVPSAFTYRTGEAHWEVLLRARAIENQCFVLAAGQGGQHSGGRETWGHSCIISPWGDLLACRTQPGPGIALADLDFNPLTALRQSMPVLRHRRF